MTNDFFFFSFSAFQFFSIFPFMQVLDAATRKPMVKTYVKVYVETHDGKVRFHKDGYTDLRGKFDYLSHSGEDPAQVRRVAILASDPQKGARTMIYNR